MYNYTRNNYQSLIHQEDVLSFLDKLDDNSIDLVIKASSKEGDLVLDLFSGTGTTSLVAKRLGRNWIGVEKQEKFCQMSRLRIEKERVRSEVSQFNVKGLESHYFLKPHEPK